ncbi:MAG: pyruvate dehydrogenase complex dihydrolipoamide acetyltransferase [Deltaproteobacteria bacterium]|nr:pyruvate dehydrogenase complex dihydrolipoamide acetyltransferase [Deltaproteobacteria bacterium]
MSEVDATTDKMIPIEMPSLSSGDDREGEGATLANWLVAVGDEVEHGEVIAELETDKATVELESPATGRLAEISIAEGTEGLRPGVLLGTIECDAAPEVEGAESDADSSGEEEAPSAPEVRDDEGASRSPAFEPPPSVPSAEAPRSTPLARRAAEANDVDLGSVQGSGPGGKVVEADVLAAAGGAPVEAKTVPGKVGGFAVSVLETTEAGAEVRIERLSAMRTTIARRMTESKQGVPHFYLDVRVAMDEVMAARARLNEGLAADEAPMKISVNDFVVRAVAGAMREVPQANVQFAEDGMRIFERVDVCVAVATEGGLVTPVVRDADRKGLVALAGEIAQLAELARSGALRPEQYQGGTVTVSNLGMYGIDTVYPILNPPQACIVGFGAATEEPIVRDGEIGVGHTACATLAADHRAVDGAVGARLLAAIRARLEDPLGMML